MTTKERQEAMLPAVQECDRLAGELARLFDKIDVLPWHAMPCGTQAKSAMHDVHQAKIHVESCCELLKRIALAN